MNLLGPLTGGTVLQLWPTVQPSCSATITVCNNRFHQSKCEAFKMYSYFVNVTNWHKCAFVKTWVDSWVAVDRHSGTLQYKDHWCLLRGCWLLEQSNTVRVITACRLLILDLSMEMMIQISVQTLSDHISEGCKHVMTECCVGHILCVFPCIIFVIQVSNVYYIR